MGELVHAQPPGFKAAREAWPHAGIRCAIIASPLGGWNGYVQLPWRHPWRGRSWGETPLGDRLTWGPDPAGWVGFDTGHAWDYWHPDDDHPGYVPDWWRHERLLPEVEAAALGELRQLRQRLAASMPGGPVVWTLPRLRAYVENLAEAVARIEAWERA